MFWVASSRVGSSIGNEPVDDGEADVVVSVLWHVSKYRSNAWFCLVLFLKIDSRS